MCDVEKRKPNNQSYRKMMPREINRRIIDIVIIKIIVIRRIERDTEMKEY